MQRCNVFYIQIGLFLAFPEIYHLDIPAAFIADIDPIPFIIFYGKVGQGLLLFIAAERTFNPLVWPLDAALIAEEVAYAFLFDLADFRLLAAYGAVPLRPRHISRS